jgi:uncharacterized protein YegL
MTDMNGFDLALLKSDLIENPTARCACALVLDTSSSMGGTPISELNAGVTQFIAELRGDDFASYAVEVGVFTFGDEVREVLPFTPAYQIKDCAPLRASGMTPMGEAVELAIEKLARRKAEYRKAGVSYYQPWLVLMSDGGPTDDWQTAARRLRKLAEERKVTVLAVGIGDGASLEILSQFSTRPAKTLAGMKFREFFAWLSQSMERVSQSTPGTGVPLAATDGWDCV